MELILLYLQLVLLPQSVAVAVEVGQVDTQTPPEKMEVLAEGRLVIPQPLKD
jgi:hypothetical protein